MTTDQPPQYGLVPPALVAYERGGHAAPPPRSLRSAGLTITHPIRGHGEFGVSTRPLKPKVPKGCRVYRQVFPPSAIDRDQGITKPLVITSYFCSGAFPNFEAAS